MKKILNFIFVTLLVTLMACKSTSCVTYGNIHQNEIGTQAIMTEKFVLNSSDFKKKCKEEKISSKLSKWNKVSFRSYEDQVAIVQYYYIKEEDYDSIVANKMYRLKLMIVDRDSTFNLEIRKTNILK